MLPTAWGVEGARPNVTHVLLSFMVGEDYEKFVILRDDISSHVIVLANGAVWFGIRNDTTF